MFLIIENNIITETHTSLDEVDIDPTTNPNVVGYVGDEPIEVGWLWNSGEVSAPK